MVTVPRPITGSVGGRIRLIFGDNGNEWLLLLDHDNGDRQWQVKDWTTGIPAAVAKQLNNCTEKRRDAKEVDFGPTSTGSWYINGAKVDGTGGHAWWGGTKASDTIKEWTSKAETLRVYFGSGMYGEETHALILGGNGYKLSHNLHTDLHNRLKRINTRKKNIHCLRLFHLNQFFLSDDEGTLWLLGNNIHLEKEVQKAGKVEEVAVARDNNWVVIRENKFVASEGVDNKLTNALSKFFSDQRRWINHRNKEIRDARAENERERLQREREVREAAEREERERVEREAAERAERERLQREAREAADREERVRIQREAREAERANREREDHDAAARISTLEAKLNQRLLDEARDIKETEEKLLRRKRSLLDEMSPEVRARSGLEDNRNHNTCVVCQDEAAVTAVVPCGHVCLCSACADTCMGRPDSGAPSCPLCRGNMQSVLKIYLGNN